MSWIDIVIVAVILVSALISMFRGFTKEFVSLVTWVVAVWLAAAYSERVAAWLPASLERADVSLGGPSVSISNLRVGLAFVLLVVSTLIAGSILNRLVGYWVGRRMLSLTDRTMGLLFGVLRGGVIVVVLVLLAGVTRLPQTPWWREARLLPPFEDGAMRVIRYLPHDYANYFSFR